MTEWRDFVFFLQIIFCKQKKINLNYVKRCKVAFRCTHFSSNDASSIFDFVEWASPCACVFLSYRIVIGWCFVTINQAVDKRVQLPVDGISVPMVYCKAKHWIYYISVVSSERLTSCLSTSNFFISHQPTHKRACSVARAHTHTHAYIYASYETHFATHSSHRLCFNLSFYFFLSTSHTHAQAHGWMKQINFTHSMQSTGSFKATQAKPI